MIYQVPTEQDTLPVLPELKPPEAFCLPAGYKQQSGNFTLDTARSNEPYWNDWRLSENGRFQHYVYRWAARLISRAQFTRVLDVGCGPAMKLQSLIMPALEEACTRASHGSTPLLVGIDQASAVAVAQASCPKGKFLVADLESPDVNFDHQFDLIICADVIEHLVNPDAILSLMRANVAPGGRILLSTPDRERERGRDCMASNKPEHVREWSRAEFQRYLTSRGFQCLTSRRFPKADMPMRPMRKAERDYQHFLSDRSPLCCQAVLCA